MTESEATAAATPAKKATKKPKAKASHPTTSVMVLDAITALKDRKGSSLAAIKKHVAANNKVDGDKIAPFIRKYLKKAVADGVLSQTKGTGANGSFKLAKPETAPKKKVAATPKKTTKKVKAAPAKKSATTKKAATPKKKKAVKKTATKSKKEKKPAKSPKKLKAPKPKKAAVKPKAKKAAPKKK